VRLVSSTRQPPIYLFILLIVVCAAAIFFITAFTVHHIPARLRIPVIAVVTLLLVSTLAVIVDLSHPYDGVTTVGPGFMTQVADASSRDFQLLWGHPQQECDGRGNPLS
jgi:cytochrome c biogenesis factor